MRWFAAFWSTVVLCFVGMGLSWLGGQDFPLVSSALRPFDFASRTLFIVPAVLAAYGLVRLILQHIVAYTESAIDASPRESRSEWSRRRASLGLVVYRWFGNPTGKWLTPFALVLGVVSILAVLVAGPEIFKADGNRFEVLGLTLIVLYAYTVTMAMAFPDRPIRLRPEPEREPKGPFGLGGVGTEAEPETAAAGATGGRNTANAKASAKKSGKPGKPPKPPKKPPAWMFWRKPKAPSPGKGSPPPPPGGSAGAPGASGASDSSGTP